MPCLLHLSELGDEQLESRATTLAWVVIGHREDPGATAGMAFGKWLTFAGRLPGRSHCESPPAPGDSEGRTSRSQAVTCWEVRRADAWSSWSSTANETGIRWTERTAWARMICERVPRWRVVNRVDLS